MDDSFLNILRWMNIILALIGIISNLLVMYVILKNPKLKTVPNIHIFNLSISDALIMVGLIFKYPAEWPHGYISCRLYVGLTSMADFACFLQVITLSADRYFSVCHPVSYARHRTVRNTYLACGLVWILSILLSLPNIYYSDLKYEGNCNPFWDNGSDKGVRERIAYMGIFGLLMPFSLMVFFYVSILLKLRKNDKQVKRVTKFAVIIIGAYILLWTPYWSLTFYYEYIGGISGNPKLDDNIFFICEYATYSNSLVNPIVYVFINKNFKESLRKSLSFELKQIGQSLKLPNDQGCTLRDVNIKSFDVVF